jgi:hypothetical protein
VDFLIIGIVALSASLGFMLGVWIRGTQFDRMPWELFHWHTDILGYRPTAYGTVLHRGQKVIMAIRLDTDDYPDEGVTMQEEDTKLE